MTPAESASHRSYNYRLCTAIDLGKLGTTLGDMVVAGRLHAEEAATFEHQAHALLAAIRNANNRSFGLDPQRPIR